MTKYRTAEIRDGGANYVLIPLDRAWSVKSGSERHALLDAIKTCAAAAGVPGTVVLVWESVDGVTELISAGEVPVSLKDLRYGDLESRATGQLTCE